MRNARLVIIHEFRTTISKTRFWISTFLFPVLILMINLGSQSAVNSAISSETAKQQAAPVQTMGYVDYAGIVRSFPSNISKDLYRAFPDEAAATTALRAGEIGSYYVVPSDWVQTGKLAVVESTFSFSLEQGPDLFQQLLTYNLVGDENLAAYLTFGTSVESYDLTPAQTSTQNSDALQMVSYATLMMFFFVMTMSSTMLLQSVTSEKENRTAEVLLTSLRPRELMLGKVIGQGCVALLQMAIWLGGAYLVLQQNPAMLGLTGGLQLPSGFLAWALLYFLLGYMMFGSAMAAIGALAPNVKESGQFTFIVLVPLMIPLFFNPVLTSDPNGAASVALSLIPFTSPVAMATRMVATNVPIWQSALGLVALAATAYGLVALAGRLFRADNLLSSASLDVQRLLRELKA